MTPGERAKKAQGLINEVKNMPSLGYSNYQAQLAEYRRILNDLLVLIRDDALDEDASASKSTPGS